MEQHLGYSPCENVEHDWIQLQDGDRTIKWCNTCHVPIRQYHGKEAVEQLRKIAELFIMESHCCIHGDLESNDGKCPWCIHQTMWGGS